MISGSGEVVVDTGREMLLTRPYRNNYGASTGNGPTLLSAGQAHIDACPQSYGPQSCHYLRIIEMEREEDYNNFTGRLFVYRPRRNGPEIDSNGGPL